jgi:wyosine [tRNA(Phe)-imidazoG37] synthetase (radical SAM superfamily)
LSGRDSCQQAVFGPVPSRRLGLSLGVDLLVPKTCTLDCVYCELGPTTHQTTQRGRFRFVQEVLAEVEECLAGLERPPQFLTLAGWGEPCLHQELGLVIERLQRLEAGRVAVLTNGTLTPDPQVRAELAQAQVVIPSLDAATPHAFRRVNRPAPGLDIAAIIEGLARLRQEMAGEMWLEILLVKGYNDSPEEIAALVEAVERIWPHKVQLGTVDRPPAVSGVEPVEASFLEEVAARMPVEAEVIPPPPRQGGGRVAGLDRLVLEMTRRRPCTLEDVAAMADLEPAQARRLVEELVRQGRLRREDYGEQTFYRGV